MLWLVLRELQGRDLTSNLLSTQFRGTQGKGQQIQSCRLKPSNQQSANTFKDKATRINVKVDCWNAAILSKAAWSTCGLFVGILCTTLFFPVIEVHGGFRHLKAEALHCQKFQGELGIFHQTAEVIQVRCRQDLRQYVERCSEGLRL